MRFWAGAPYSGKETAPWVKRENGVEEEWLNGVLVRRKGIVEGNYFDELYNSNGQLAKRTALIDGKILEQWYNNGVLVYEIGQNGIYFVAEIAESFTLVRLLNLRSNASTSDGTIFHNTLRSYMYQKAGNLSQFELRGNKDSYRYNAGQNVYSELNKQYEGYKNTQNKIDNIADGWYALEQLGWMFEDGLNPSLREAQLIRVSSGKVAQSISTMIETAGYTFNQF